jgi:uncharacterized membrane protein YkvA (DUF1232 family)
MGEFIMLLPRLVKLLGRLLSDPRVSRTDKIILAGTIVYVFVPLDFLPDMIPFIGQVDDSYLVAISILRMLNRADADVVAGHWDGTLDIKRLATTMANVATFFLPSRVKGLLTARVNIKEPSALRLVGGEKPKSAERG